MKFKDVLKLKYMNNKELEEYIVNEGRDYYNNNNLNIEDFLDNRFEVCTDFIENENGIIEVYESSVEFKKDGKDTKIIKYYHIYYYSNRDKFDNVDYDLVERFI